MKILLRSLLGLLFLGFLLATPSSARIDGMPVPQVRVLCASASSVAAPADTSADTLATCTIPGGTLGPNGVLRVSSKWLYTASANAKTVRVVFGGTTFGQGAAAGASDVSQNHIVLIHNRNATNAQIGGVIGAGSGGYGSSVGVASTGTIDTTASQSLILSGQKASAGETLSLESYLVEVIVP